MELITIESSDRLSFVALVGRLDLAGVQAVELKFNAQVASRKVASIVDLSGVTFIASLGMRMLLSAAKTLKANNVKLVVVKPQPLVEEALKSAGLDALMVICSSVEEAKAKVA
jgi:anti-anti-sigma factor